MALDEFIRRARKTSFDSPGLKPRFSSPKPSSLSLRVNSPMINCISPDVRPSIPDSALFGLKQIYLADISPGHSSRKEFDEGKKEFEKKYDAPDDTNKGAPIMSPSVPIRSASKYVPPHSTNSTPTNRISPSVRNFSMARMPSTSPITKNEKKYITPTNADKKSYSNLLPPSTPHKSDGMSSLPSTPKSVSGMTPRSAKRYGTDYSFCIKEANNKDGCKMLMYNCNQRHTEESYKRLGYDYTINILHARENKDFTPDNALAYIKGITTAVAELHPELDIEIIIQSIKLFNLTPTGIEKIMNIISPPLITPINKVISRTVTPDHQSGYQPTSLFNNDTHSMFSFHS